MYKVQEIVTKCDMPSSETHRNSLSYSSFILQFISEVTPKNERGKKQYVVS